MLATTTGSLTDLYPDHTLKLGVADLIFTNHQIVISKQILTDPFLVS